MRQKRPWLVPLLGFLALAFWPAVGGAQSSNNFTVGLMAGLGGSTEDDPETDLDNFSFQVLLDMRIDNNTLWGVRLGRLDLDTDVFDAELSYLTISGEYLYSESAFESGLYLGLGLYDFDGGGAEDDTALGLVLGVTGEIDLSERFSVLLELSGHYADLDQTQFFLIGHLGLGYHF